MTRRDVSRTHSLKVSTPSPFLAFTDPWFQRTRDIEAFPLRASCDERRPHSSESDPQDPAEHSRPRRPSDDTIRHVISLG